MSWLFWENKSSCTLKLSSELSYSRIYIILKLLNNFLIQRIRSRRAARQVENDSFIFHILITDKLIRVCQFSRVQWTRGIHRPGFVKHYAQVVARSGTHRHGEYTLARISSSRFGRMAETRSIEALMYKLQLSRFRSFPRPTFYSLYQHDSEKGVSASIYHFRFPFPHRQSFPNTLDLFFFCTFSIYSSFL